MNGAQQSVYPIYASRQQNSPRRKPRKLAKRKRMMMMTRI